MNRRSPDNRNGISVREMLTITIGSDPMIPNVTDRRIVAENISVGLVKIGPPVGDSSPRDGASMNANASSR